MLHTCPQCSREFKDRRPHAKFCSFACRGLSQRTLPEIPCERCGTPFRPKDQTRFCSRVCYDADRQDNAEPLNHTCAHCGRAFHDSHPETRFCSRECFGLHLSAGAHSVCRVCGTVFAHAPSRPALYCSAECRGAKRRVMCKVCNRPFLRAKRSQAFCSRPCRDLARTGDRPDRDCPQCGKSFSPPKSNPVFCSLRCYGLSLQGNQPRAGNNFTPKQKRLIRQRDGWKCKVCGGLDGLAFDHVLAVAKGGTNAVANGQVLCETCHKEKTNRDLERKQWRALPPDRTPA